MAPLDAALRLALRRLPAADRALLELSLRRGVPDGEIATLLDLGATHVSARSSRLLERLAAEVGEEAPGGAGQVREALSGEDAPVWVDAPEEPGDAAGKPGSMPDEPGHADEEPDATRGDPDAAAEPDAAEEPDVVSEEPDVVGEEPDGVSEEPDVATEPDAAAEEADAARLARRAGAVLLALLPGALTAYFGFNAGGFFAGGPAIVAVALCVVLLLRLTLADEPLAGLAAWGLPALALLAAFTAWTLLSGSWSDAPARALIESDRALLYLLACLLFATVPRSTRGIRLMLWGFAAAAVVICLAGLASRVLPDLVHAGQNVRAERLSHPVTYWNALGIVAALGILACFHITASEREPRTARVLAAAAVPALAVTLLFTFSRGAIAVALVSLVVYAVLARPRGLLSALLAVIPASVAALLVAYGADLLATERWNAPAAAGQAEDVALVTGLAMAAAALLRAALLPVDARLARIRVASRTRRLVLGSAAAIAIVSGAVAGLAVDAPRKLERQYDRFVGGAEFDSSPDARERLSSPTNNGRLDHWRVALDSFESDRLKGSGAGTYEQEWARERPGQFIVIDAHSLPLEVLGELGLPGLVLLGGALLVLVVGVAVQMRGPDRALYAALFAMALAWLVHAGIDWDWEMPVTTLWLFALGGAALARPAGAARAPAPVLGRPARLVRVVAGLMALACALVPGRIYLSQQRLDAAVRDFERGACPGAIDHALAANSALSLRPEPFEVLAYCDVRLGRPGLAVRAMEEAVERDPGAWQLRYGLALVRAAAGRDPRPAARAALRLNPNEPLARDAVRRFRGGDPRKWKRRAPSARLPFG